MADEPVEVQLRRAMDAHRRNGATSGMVTASVDDDRSIDLIAARGATRAP